MTFNPTVKTMKQPLILVLLLFLCSFLKAQEYAIGIKGGINYYNIGDINSRGGSIQAGKPDEIFIPNNEIGTQFGVFINVAFNKFYIRPEINFVSNNNNYDFPTDTAQWEVSKIDLPLLIGYKVFDPISIYVGPNFSFFNEMTLEGANNNSDPNPINYEKTTTSLMFGIQVEFKRFGVDLRYEIGLKETAEEFNDFIRSAYGINLADIYAYKPSQISLSLNIFLFRTDGDDISNLFDGLFRSKACNCLKN